MTCDYCNASMQLKLRKHMSEGHECRCLNDACLQYQTTKSNNAGIFFVGLNISMRKVLVMIYFYATLGVRKSYLYKEK